MTGAFRTCPGCASLFGLGDQHACPGYSFTPAAAPPPFVGFPKLARLSRAMAVTEKLDGTNAQVLVTARGEVYAGSRTRWVTPESDNYGFAAWVAAHAEELRGLGPGAHFGEWWGAGIQRRYGLEEKRFSLFDVDRWSDGRAVRPACCGVVPVLYRGDFDTYSVDVMLDKLASGGSVAAPGFVQPEGVVVYHYATRTMFKKTLDANDQHKGVTP